MYRIEKDGKRIRYIDEEEKREAALPLENFMGIYETGNPPPVKEEDIEKAVISPAGRGEGLRDLVSRKGAETAAIIISDATRGVPTDKTAPYIIRELTEAGIKKENIVFVVALGVHRNATESEMKEFLGPLMGKIAIENHDAFDEQKLVYLGMTSRHTPVKVNKRVYESDVVITIGKVELHDMAGFSGGRKSILPGISSEETIVINHRPEMMVHHGSRAGNLEGNPIHEDMLEAAEMCGVDYSVNIVMNQEYEIAGIFSGGLRESHEAAAEFLKSFCMAVLPARPDIYVVCPGQPLSIDMYQGVKPLIALHTMADENTTVILYGEFKEGINAPDFIEPFRNYPNLEELKTYVWNHYKIQMDHIVPIREILSKGTRIMVVSENISAEDAAAMHMEKYHTLQEALEKAIEEHPAACPQVALCPQSYRSLFTVGQEQTQSSK